MQFKNHKSNFTINSFIKREFLMVKYYKEGKLSLGSLAKKLDISISEAIDLLSKLGIESPIEYEDYLKGFEVFKDK